jgi:hypothetical protein
MSKDHFISSSVVRKWISDDLDSSYIEQKLRSEDFQEDHIDAYLKEYKKEKIRQKQTKGFIVTGVGAALGFISCVLTLTNPYPEFFNLILYGLTSVALVFILIGLYLVLE